MKRKLTKDFPVLTPDEIEATAAVADKGFTVRTTGPQAGKFARNQLSVGFAPEGGRAEEVKVQPGSGAFGRIAAFASAKMGILRTPGATMGIGGWIDPEASEGNDGTVMDTSVLLPKSKSGMQAAMQLGSLSNQESIGHLGYSAKKPYRGDIPVPPDVRPGVLEDQAARHGRPRRRPVPASRQDRRIPTWNDDQADPMKPDVRTRPRTGVTGRQGVTYEITPSRMEAADLAASHAAESMGLRSTDVYDTKPLSAEEYVAKGKKTRR
jgi:hypothetical protein